MFTFISMFTGVPSPLVTLSWPPRAGNRKFYFQGYLWNTVLVTSSFVQCKCSRNALSRGAVGPAVPCSMAWEFSAAWHCCPRGILLTSWLSVPVLLESSVTTAAICVFWSCHCGLFVLRFITCIVSFLWRCCIDSAKSALSNVNVA